MQADIEKLMARLLTDRALRERFLADPAAVAEAHGLSPLEAEAIARMPPEDLHAAARSYDNKRESKLHAGRKPPMLGWCWIGFDGRKHRWVAAVSNTGVSALMTQHRPHRG